MLVLLDLFLSVEFDSSKQHIRLTVVFSAKQMLSRLMNCSVTSTSRGVLLCRSEFHV